MTDKRYQQDLNSLVRRKQRKGLGPAKPRAPVPGGQGFAGFGISPCEQEDVVFGIGWDTSRIYRCDPTNGETYWRDSIDGTFITVYRDLFYNGFVNIVRRNGTVILNGTHDNIGGLSCNNEELFISDDIASPAGYRLRVYDHDTLTLQRTISNFLTSDSTSNTSIACGPTHYAVTQAGVLPDEGRFAIFDNDDNLEVQVNGLTMANKFPVAIDGNRAYFIHLDGSNNPKYVHIYDLDGNKITEWTIPYAFTTAIYGLEITVGGIWFSGYSVTGGKSVFTYYERGASPDTFSSTRQEFDYEVGYELTGCSRNRCDSLFV